MSDNTSISLAIQLGENEPQLIFHNPTELKEWNDNENQKWAWLRQVGLINQRDNFYNQLNSYCSEWNQVQQNPQQLDRILNQIKDSFSQFYARKSFLISSSPRGHFVINIRENRGDQVAAGAYAAILGLPFQINGQTQVEYLEGIIEAFLYKREVDWTATAHQEALAQLENKYEANLTLQDQDHSLLKKKNQNLNDKFDTTLTEKGDLLDKLHAKQTSDFSTLIEQHENNLKAIENAYDQKLALQKPVKYWQTKAKQHNRLAWIFGLIALFSGLGAAGGMGYLAHEYLGKLPPTESPKHWQIGLLVIGAFFSVWLVRIFVRLFFSNIHLATDASERRMIILTYIAMLREGTQFETEDKKHIIQHIFRSASDGLVKDDAAPPTLFELFTRK